MSAQDDEDIRKLVVLLCIVGLIVTIILMGIREEPDGMDMKYMPTPPNASYIKGVDYSKPGIQYKYYSDEEIREMREGLPGSIIRVPGRRILSREAQLREDYEELLIEIEDETSYLPDN